MLLKPDNLHYCGFIKGQCDWEVCYVMHLYLLSLQVGYLKSISVGSSNIDGC
jgi:hypothetical protein